LVVVSHPDISHICVVAIVAELYCKMVPFADLTVSEVLVFSTWKAEESATAYFGSFVSSPYVATSGPTMPFLWSQPTRMVDLVFDRPPSWISYPLPRLGSPPLLRKIRALLVVSAENTKVYGSTKLSSAIWCAYVLLLAVVVVWGAEVGRLRSTTVLAVPPASALTDLHALQSILSFPLSCKSVHCQSAAHMASASDNEPTK
jgi:hypothetical protein